MKKEGEVLAPRSSQQCILEKRKTSASLNIYDSSLTKSPNTLWASHCAQTRAVCNAYSHPGHHPEILIQEVLDETRESQFYILYTHTHTHTSYIPIISVPRTWCKHFMLNPIAEWLGNGLGGHGGGGGGEGGGGSSTFFKRSEGFVHRYFPSLWKQDCLLCSQTRRREVIVRILKLWLCTMNILKPTGILQGTQETTQEVSFWSLWGQK